MHVRAFFAATSQLAVLILAAPVAEAGEQTLVNLAPLAGVRASAQMDSAHGAVNINDDDPETYWSAWPYTMRGKQDVITLDVTLPLPAVVRRVEIESGYRSPQIELSVRSKGRWRTHGATFTWPETGPRFVWEEPITLDALRFEFPRIRAEQAGVVIHELRILGELGPSAGIVSALSDEQTPDFDWQRIPGALTMRCSSGDAGAAADGRPETAWRPDEPQNSWIEATLRPARPVQRIEMVWQGAGYARRTVLELHLEDGRILFVPRQWFSTSFTFPEPLRVSRLRLHCTQVGAEVALAELRLFSRGKHPVPPSKPQVALWAETALVKVRRDATGPHELSPFKRGGPLRIQLARNEYEAGQVIVRSNGDRVLRDVQVTIENLRSHEGAVLPADAIAVNPLAYVNSEFADVLLPPGPFKVAAGQARPTWLTVHAGPDVAPGLYRGQVLCSCAGKMVARLPIEVTVWDVTLPRQTTFKTHYFAIWGTGRFLRDALRDPRQRQRLLAGTAEQFIRHRISPGRAFVMEDYEKELAKLSWSEYLAAFDKWTQRLLDGGLPFVGVLQGPRFGLQGGPTSEKEYWQFFEKYLEEKGWLDKFAVTVGDEPPPGNQRVTNQAKKFMEWTPKLRRQCAFSSFGKGGTPTWSGLINEWGICPRTYGATRLEDIAEFSHERMKAGDGVSWYIHHALSVDMTPYFPRMYLWYLWRNRIKAALLYGVAEWAHRDVDRWEDGFVIHGTGFRTWGVLLWPGRGRLLDSVRWEAIRDGIEDYELHVILEAAIEQAARKNPYHPKLARARKVLDDTDKLFVAFNADQADKAKAYRIQDRHADSPVLCTNAVPADLLTAREAIVESIIALRQVAAESAAVPDAPQWARRYADGLRAWRDIIYYWIDRQRANGTFGFGWGEDCEMIVGWPGVMMAADDKRIQRAIDRLADNRWFNPNVQNGYVFVATDAEHGPEPISYTNPVLLYQEFGSPRLIERLMVTAKNVEHWTGVTPRGDRHMRSTYFGSQQLRDWPFYDEDSPINARAWIPMMHLLLYNRDPYLMKYFTEWADAWAKHAMAEGHGKPPGVLPGQVTFKTGQPGGYTRNWWGAGSHDFSSLWYQTRLHEVLVIAYAVTGKDKYIEPLREMLRFFSTYARPPVGKGEPLPPDRLPAKYTFPAEWRDGTASTRWARDVGWGHFANWYYYLTGDTQFDAKFGQLFGKKIERGPFARIDKGIVERGHRRAVSFRESYFTQVVPKLKYAGSLANYAAAWWQKHYGTMTFGQRCFRDGGDLANSVNWPWVDYPPPSVVWKETGYQTGIFMLEDGQQRLRVALANLAPQARRIGAQLFTLDEGTYQMQLGPDADEDGKMDALSRSDRVEVERGTTVWFELPRNVTMLLELTRTADSGPAPPWRPRPDLGLDPRDIMISKEHPSPGERVSIKVRVHNIGTKPAAKATVELMTRRDGRDVVLASAVLDRIDPPQRLAPSFVDVPIAWTVAGGVETIGAVIDRHDAIDELYEHNNAAWAKLAELKTSQRQKRFVQHGPAVKPSLADVDPTKLSRYDVPFRSGIKLDGVIDEREWQGIEPFELIAHDPSRPLRKRSWMQVAYDNEALYLALRCDEPDMNLLKTDLPRIDDIYYNDGFEIFLDPGAQVWRYWQFCFDTVPHKFQTLTRNRYAPKAAWDVAIRKADKMWSAEVRFPFSSFDAEPPKAGARWRMNVMRYTTTFRDPENPQARHSERSHFSPKGKLHHHHKPEIFGDLYFKPK